MLCDPRKCISRYGLKTFGSDIELSSLTKSLTVIWIGLKLNRMLHEIGDNDSAPVNPQSSENFEAIEMAFSPLPKRTLINLEFTDEILHDLK